MPIPFPSPEWVQAYKEAINANANYKTAAKDWTHGVVAMVVKAAPELGIAEDLAMWLDVHEGVCRETKLLPAKDAQGANFVIEADYPKWKSVIRKELDPIKAMMQGKLKVTKGNMPTLVKYVHSNRELVESATHVDTQFRDEK
jgi:putative sterol carrier protein